MSQAPMNYSTPGASKPAGLAIASMVLGIVSLLFCIWYIAIPCGILAIVFGIIAGNKAKTGEGGGAGMAKAGFIMGCIGLAIDIIIVILIFTVGLAFFKNAQSQLKTMQQQQQQMQQSVPSMPAAPTPPAAPSPAPQ
jgi:hypothetical protein